MDEITKWKLVLVAALLGVLMLAAIVINGH
jgi:hypothetical protein